MRSRPDGVKLPQTQTSLKGHDMPYADGLLYINLQEVFDVFTATTTLEVMQSIRLELGYGSQAHP
jgi:hypothetical protein